MGPRSCLTLLALTAVGSTPAPAAPSATTVSKPAAMAERVVADFEGAVKTSKDAYVGLFDFHAVGEIEILLHRYDLYGRLQNLPDDVMAQFAAEDGTPYPAERERTNVGNFYKVLAQRTVGTGGCVAGLPRTRYAKLLGQYEPLPPHTPEKYEKLRTAATGYLAKGGVVGMRCRGGKGGLVLVWTEKPGDRGYELITIYDD